MAIPPEPIDEVLPDASSAVVGEVTAIVHEDPQAPLPKSEPGMSDVPGDVALQRVSLRVDKVLFGDVSVGDVVEVVKPAGDYKLAVGNHGPFLLGPPAAGQPHPHIVGRYGPDTYSEGLITDAAKRHGR